MRYTVIVEPPAEEDIEEAYLWIASNSRSSAIKWFNDIMESVTTLQVSPERCSFALENDFFDEDIRQLLFGKRHGVYRILFTIRCDCVHVLHVRHCARERFDM